MLTYARRSAPRILLALSLAAALGACGSKEKDAAAPVETAAASAAPEVSDEPTETESPQTESPRTESPEPSASASGDTATDGSKEGALKNLTFTYPSDWKLKKDDADGSTTVSISDSSGFRVVISAEKAGSATAKAGGACGACEFVKTVASFELGGKTVYLLDQIKKAGTSAGPILSACEGKKKCPAKFPTGDLLDVYVAYNVPTKPAAGETGGPGGPDEFTTSLPGYAEALKIIKSLAYSG